MVKIAIHTGTKVLEQDISSPHVHDPKSPGGIRYPESGEIPK